MSPIRTGIPPGSPVTPILFLLYLAPLFDVLENNYPDTTCPSYSDDVGVLLIGKREAANSKILEMMATTCVE